MKHRQQILILNEENFKWIKKKKKWNEDERTKLIELIEERECLQTL